MSKPACSLLDDIRVDDSSDEDSSSDESNTTGKSPSTAKSVHSAAASPPAASAQPDGPNAASSSDDDSDAEYEAQPAAASPLPAMPSGGMAANEFSSSGSASPKSPSPDFQPKVRPARNFAAVAITDSDEESDVQFAAEDSDDDDDAKKGGSKGTSAGTAPPQQAAASPVPEAAKKQYSDSDDASSGGKAKPAAPTSRMQPDDDSSSDSSDVDVKVSLPSLTQPVNPVASLTTQRTPFDSPSPLRAASVSTESPRLLAVDDATPVPPARPEQQASTVEEITLSPVHKQETQPPSAAPTSPPSSPASPTAEERKAKLAALRAKREQQKRELSQSSADEQPPVVATPIAKSQPVVNTPSPIKQPPAVIPRESTPPRPSTMPTPIPKAAAPTPTPRSNPSPKAKKGATLYDRGLMQRARTERWREKEADRREAEASKTCTFAPTISARAHEAPRGSLYADRSREKALLCASQRQAELAAEDLTFKPKLSTATQQIVRRCRSATPAERVAVSERLHLDGVRREINHEHVANPPTPDGKKISSSEAAAVTARLYEWEKKRNESLEQQQVAAEPHIPPVKSINSVVKRLASYSHQHHQELDITHYSPRLMQSNPRISGRSRDLADARKRRVIGAWFDAIESGGTVSVSSARVPQGSKTAVHLMLSLREALGDSNASAALPRNDFVEILLQFDSQCGPHIWSSQEPPAPPPAAASSGDSKKKTDGRVFQRLTAKRKVRMVREESPEDEKPPLAIRKPVRRSPVRRVENTLLESPEEEGATRLDLSATATPQPEPTPPCSSGASSAAIDILDLIDASMHQFKDDGEGKSASVSLSVAVDSPQSAERAYHHDASPLPAPEVVNAPLEPTAESPHRQVVVSERPQVADVTNENSGMRDVSVVSSGGGSNAAISPTKMKRSVLLVCAENRRERKRISTGIWCSSSSDKSTQERLKSFGKRLAEEQLAHFGGKF